MIIVYCYYKRVQKYKKFPEKEAESPLILFHRTKNARFQKK